MPRIPFQTQGVPGAPTRGTIEVHWAELAWAAVTVGKWRDDLFSHGVYSSYEAAYRLNLLFAYLREENNLLVRTGAYEDLDPTEKSGVSYHLGMITAKVLADRLLETPWLMHLDRYRMVYGVALAPGRTRPDLFGPRDMDQMDDWVVLEAKGRTNEVRQDVVAAMANQKSRVVTVGGKEPWVRGGVACHFSNAFLEAVFVDPRPRRRETRREAFEDYTSEPSLFARAYYAPIFALLSDPSRPSAETLQAARARSVREADAAIGLMPDAGVETQASSRLVIREPVFNLGRDGVFVQLGGSWSEDSMRREPGDREPSTFVA